MEDTDVEPRSVKRRKTDQLATSKTASAAKKRSAKSKVKGNSSSAAAADGDAAERLRQAQEALKDLEKKDSRKGPRPGEVKNKLRRRQLHAEQKKAKAKDKREKREKRQKIEKEYGVTLPKLPQRTIENTRVFDETVVDPDDEEILEDQATDELAQYFTSGKRPKVLITTSNKPVGETFKFAEELANLIPESEFRPRKGFDLKEIIRLANERDFTDLVVINEDRKKPTALWLIHLPDGPTAHFKLSSIQYPKEIEGHGRATTHYPEVIVNNFHTRLGHQVGRMLSAIWPQSAEFHGRSVVTFHNQRDFIFFRRHRYIFKSKEKVGLQELGPRFTLKLRSLQKGTFDSKFGEYEWIFKPEIGTGKKKFFL